MTEVSHRARSLAVMTNSADPNGQRLQTVVSDGLHEPFIARSHTETLARLIPGAKLLILPDVIQPGLSIAPKTLEQVYLNAAALRLDGAVRLAPR